MRRLPIVVVTALLGCASTKPPNPAQLTVVLRGDGRPVDRARQALVGPLDLPVVVRVAPLPNAPEVDTGTPALEASLATARRAYVDGQFAECQRAIAREDA